MISQTSDWIKGFPPVISENSRVLILGSMPGVASLEAQAYYAHPRNAFWPIMSDLLGVDLKAPYEVRLQQLLNSGVALWDLFYLCERQGSLDAHIRKGSEQINDFQSLFINYPNISAVFCNGGKAYQTYQRLVYRPMGGAGIEASCLPSTSPAHARINFEAKRLAWRVILDALPSTNEKRS